MSKAKIEVRSGVTRDGNVIIVSLHWDVNKIKMEIYS